MPPQLSLLIITSDLEQAFRARHLRKAGFDSKARHGVTSGVSRETSLNNAFARSNNHQTWLNKWSQNLACGVMTASTVIYPRNVTPHPHREDLGAPGVCVGTCGNGGQRPMRSCDRCGQRPLRSTTAVCERVLGYGVRAPVSYGNQREQTGENEFLQE